MGQPYFAENGNGESTPFSGANPPLPTFSHSPSFPLLPFSVVTGPMVHIVWQPQAERVVHILQPSYSCH